MNIKKYIPCTKVEFRKLNIGDGFRAGNGLLYMVVDAYATCDHCTFGCNAVDLCTGLLEHFNGGALVQPVGYELIIKS